MRPWACNIDGDRTPVSIAVWLESHSGIRTGHDGVKLDFFSAITSVRAARATLLPAWVDIWRNACHIFTLLPIWFRTIQIFAGAKRTLCETKPERGHMQRELSYSRRFPLAWDRSHRDASPNSVVSLNCADGDWRDHSSVRRYPWLAGRSRRKDGLRGRFRKANQEAQVSAWHIPARHRECKNRRRALFRDFPLKAFVAFAYKLLPAEISAKLPKSFSQDDLFEIEARAPGNPTKDQLRLMMQSLLADRFKLRVHFETREGPVFALSLVRPGHIGPKLHPHADGPACPDSFEMGSMLSPPRNANDAFPSMCGVTQTTRAANATLLGARDITMEEFAEGALYGMGSLTGEVDKPVADQTGLKGRYDFRLELPVGTFSFSPAPPNPDAPPANPKGTPFLNAVREQLGLKLVSSKGPIRKLVIDHAEPPSGN